MADQNVKAQNVTMYPEDWGVVEAYAEEMASELGTKSTSLALRMIVRQWVKLTNFQQPENKPESIAA